MPCTQNNSFQQCITITHFGSLYIVIKYINTHPTRSNDDMLPSDVSYKWRLHTFWSFFMPKIRNKRALEIFFVQTTKQSITALERGIKRGKVCRQWFKYSVKKVMLELIHLPNVVWTLWEFITLIWNVCDQL